MPQIPTNLTFTAPDGTVLTQGPGADTAPITVKDALVIAATNEFPEDGQANPNLITQKINRYNIWQKLVKLEGEVIHFTAEECAELKHRVARCFGVVVAGPLMQLLDGTHESQKPAPVQN